MSKEQYFYKLVEEFNDKNISPIRKGTIALMLGNLGDPKAFVYLSRALEDKDDYIRTYAALALGNLGDLRAVEPLIQALKDKKIEVRKNVIYALGELGDQKAVESLLDALKQKKEKNRGAILFSLGKLGDSRALDPLLQNLNDKDHEIRENVIYGLGELGNEKAVDPLLNALKQKKEKNRGAILFSLGKLGDSRALDPLLQNLNDKDPNIRECAIIGLGELGNEKAFEPLIQALLDDSDSCRFNAAIALGKIRNVKAKDLLIRNLNNKNKFDQAGAAIALIELGDSRAIEQFIKIFELLKKKKGWKYGFISSAAREMLKRIEYPTEFIRELHDYLNNKSIIEFAMEKLKNNLPQICENRKRFLETSGQEFKSDIIKSKIEGVKKGIVTTDINEFIKTARTNPAYCLIKISIIKDIYQSIMEKLELGTSTEDTIEKLEKIVTGVCPLCGIIYHGKGLSLVAIYQINPQLLNKTIGLDPKILGIVQNNKCVNSDCNSDEIVICFNMIYDNRVAGYYEDEAAKFLGLVE